MTGLIIDTSGPWLNLAVCRAGKVLASVLQQAGNRQAEILPEELGKILSAAKLNLSDINWLAVTAGPGSFTGLRVGISFAQGLAMGSSIKLLSLNTLDVMASLPEGFTGNISPMLDAKKGQVYTALYRSEKGVSQIISSYQVVEPRTWLSQLPPQTKIFGSGALAYRELISGSYPQLQIDEACPNGPEISGLVKLAIKKRQEENFVPAEELDAFYIRPSDAVVKSHV
ncbi:tRNA (adenosine(37)-N6)-threonylcarbamoyltransferase complex dimerization subunit type 1 TsaB [candidate division TA06 bacterium]|uniref:tRNA (Adenosine(37)-N6)-threonylcarbamoyltransferase complex dimerization subunit type 1 TsaB n=1 Tax=candidate division TA06 bacterium TaxID=2250710 RepID=A0A933IEL1_UNCT6|nr:tRNA (adenosine(37)-N6)-threonylcarbamoyltransferase complex dimerization subunit type 1 TsaB [candidate division TA06 bacterium]